MGDRTGIQWTDATWNPVTGCSKVSPGCANCYAETVAKRFPEKFTDDGTFRPWTPENTGHNVLLHPDRLDQPLRWTRPRMVFVNSMSDLFHDDVPAEFIAEVFAVMAAAPTHTFQLLTKRPERMQAVVGSPLFRNVVEAKLAALIRGGAAAPPDYLAGTWPLLNVWLGVSIENRRYVDRADVLRATPADVRFISAEPLIGPVVYDRWTGDPGHQVHGSWLDVYDGPQLDLTNIDWLIVGGESGPDARTMDLAWVRALRDACAASGTAFFMKQLGTRLAAGLASRKGDDPDEWPEDIRVRQMPDLYRQRWMLGPTQAGPS
ncbi:Phage protein [Patulibacter medicamentivorans]|uniref:Phage protein n=1 Tax=Patulibacter medicamentivorans TaxID=1097667 RepID=H0E9R3_9ACTN|nr:phage Gp37/Gp68 family protein [Patulibacter medicamentivorans]EHN09607.1 Phage protein [Patulibacter medicamentivorans]